MSAAATVDLTALADDLSRAANIGIQDAAQQLLTEGATRVAAQMSALAPRRTGFLANSITTSFPDPYTAVIGPTAYYGSFVEWGTGPHVIRPRKPGGVLVFTVGGRKVFARVVHHPGTKAQPFARPAAAEVTGYLAGQLADAGVRLVMG